MAEQRTALAQKTALAHQFDDLAQQYEASNLGMWAFLLTEVMFFGGLFVSYTVYRTAYLAGFIAGSQHLNVLLGTLNTAVLLSSRATRPYCPRRRAPRRRGSRTPPSARRPGP